MLTVEAQNNQVKTVLFLLDALGELRMLEYNPSHSLKSNMTGRCVVC